MVTGYGYSSIFRNLFFRPGQEGESKGEEREDTVKKG